MDLSAVYEVEDLTQNEEVEDEGEVSRGANFLKKNQKLQLND